VRPLGDGLVAYGKNGAYYVPVEGGIAGRPRRITRAKTTHRNSVGGTEYGHCFLDDDSVLYTVTPGGDVIEQGYDEFLVGMATAKPLITYDPLNSEYWICTGDKSFILTQNGLSSCEVSLTGLHVHNNTRYTTSTLGNNTPVYAKTDTFDLGNRGIKMVESVEVACSGITSLSVKVEYRNSDGAYKERVARCNSQGIAVPHICGVDFRVRVDGVTTGGAKIDYLNIRWKQTDKRFIRGPYSTSVSE
jgi:hypothetical protein